MNGINQFIDQQNEREQKRYRYEISKLNEQQRQQLENLVTRMAEAGAKDPLTWAWSEFKEGIPQWARFMVLKGLYQSAHDVENNIAAAHDFPPGPADVCSEIAAAVGEERLKQFLITYGKGMLHNMIGLLDEGNFDYESNDSWLLMTHNRESGELGKPVSGLHEDFLDFEQAVNGHLGEGH